MKFPQLERILIELHFVVTTGPVMCATYNCGGGGVPFVSGTENVD
jgi:hypothetical protein